MKLIHLPKKAKELLTRTQSAVEQRVHVGTDNELAQPSRFWVKATAWTLMGTTVLAIGWLAIAETEEIVVATGKLEPLGEVKPVQVPQGGVVEEILVKEGEKVSAGQLLLQMDTEATLGETLNLSESIAFKQEQLQLKLQEKQITLDQLTSELNVLKRNLILQQEVEERLIFLEKQGAGS